jgi:hypothetical protein
MTQSTIDALVNVTPSVGAADYNVRNIKSRSAIIENQIRDKAELSGDTTKLREERDALLQALPLAEANYNLLKYATEVKLGQFDTAQDYLNSLSIERAVQEDAQKRSSAVSEQAFMAPAAGAGTTAETPKKPVELNFFEQALLEEAPAKRKELEESSNQWAGAKQSIRRALGTGENGLEKIALEVFKADVLGKGLPFVKARLIERIANEVGGRIPQGTKNAPIKFGLTDTAFSQKSYRFGPNAVTWYEVIGTIADDLIGQYEKAQIGANAPTTNTSLESKNPSLGAVSAVPVP